jgi:very-short-patch-repair endonuclease
MSILRTIADLSQRLPLVEAVVAVDMVLRLRLVDLPGLLGLAATRAGRMGVVRLRRVVELADPAAESAMETRLRVLLVLGGLSRPRAQVRLHDERGRFLGRPDLYYPAHRLGIEYDGGTHRDRLVNSGFRLLRYTASDVLGSPEQVIRQVRAALGSPKAPEGL